MTKEELKNIITNCYWYNQEDKDLLLRHLDYLSDEFADSERNMVEDEREICIDANTIGELKRNIAGLDDSAVIDDGCISVYEMVLESEKDFRSRIESELEEYIWQLHVEELNQKEEAEERSKKLAELEAYKDPEVLQATIDELKYRMNK
jgi:hypothetical protein